MKRSNLFLTLTTGCLAVASFAFAKSHQKSFTQGFCTRAGNGHLCTVVTASVNGNYGTIVSGNKARCVSGKTAHTQLANKACGHTLYTQSAD